MIKHTVLVCLILVIATISTVAQVHLHYMDSLKIKNYDKIVELTENYYADKEKGKGTGYKQFVRWKNLNSKRLDKRGNIVNFTAINKIELAKVKNRLIPNNSSWSSAAAPKFESRFDFGVGGLGRINCIAIHPTEDDIIYAGAPNSFWKTETGGADWNDDGAAPAWIPLMEDIPAGVSGIVIDPVSTETVYALTGDGDGGDTYSLGVYKSVDGGANWNPTNLQWDGSDQVRGYKLARHSSGRIFAVTNMGIYKSDVNGNWVNTNPVKTGGFYDIEFHPTSSDIMYASQNNEIYRSVDTGNTWLEIANTEISGTSRIALAVTTASPDYVYALYGGIAPSGMFNGLYRSTDKGLSFNLRSNSPNIIGRFLDGTENQATYDLALAVNPDNAQEVQVGGINCARSIDGGITWEMTSYSRTSTNIDGIYTHADIHALIYKNGILYCGSDGGIYKSENSDSDIISTHASYTIANIDWKNISYGLQITQIYEIGINKNPLSGSGISYGSQDNGLSLANYQNGNWNKWEQISSGDGFHTEFDPFDSNIVYGKFNSTGWVRFNISDYTKVGLTPLFPPPSWTGPFDLNKFDGAMTIFMNNDIYRLDNPSTDSNADWFNLSEGNLLTPTAVKTLKVAPSNSDIIFVCGKGPIGAFTFAPVISMTYNKGQSWNSFQLSTSVLDIEFHPTNPKIAWITLAGHYDESFGRVFKTINGGNTWQDISNDNGLPQVPVNSIAYQNGSNNMLYVGTDVGVYYKDDNMNNWGQFNANLPAVMVTELEINYCTDMIYAGTYGRGVWESPLQNSSFSEDLTISNVHQNSNIFLSNTYINSIADVDNDVNVVYQGSTAVCLQPGFIAMPNNDNYFCGQIIDPCNVTVPFTANRVIGDIVQNMDGIVIENVGGNRIIEEIFEDANLKILGNPSPSETAVSFDLETQSKVSLHIYDQQGKFIKQILDNVNLDLGNHQYNLQLSDHQKGVYFIALSYGGKKSIRKLVKL